ncbi:hypothetical protein CORC01_11050 [Colletotrichum orchidophilum]|uniref:Uncharacterized protein n=1 Tax=Colletotrichum orchidophilum TaxID=1209926 RepID=A0A1G4AWY0_9PEZI|nr:uncharacterized protein CORC01_11050 [Colletotrichum orchidophilum]OHE93647.1 hypothetical protein CORC01_11050 [Colletotrichum orchidophilum]
MSTSRSFHYFEKLPSEIRREIYEASEQEALTQLMWTNNKIRNEVLDHLYRDVSLIGLPMELNRLLRKRLVAPQAVGKLRSIPSAYRVLTIVIVRSLPVGWEIFGSNWRVQGCPSLVSNMIAVLIDGDFLRVLNLDLLGLDTEDLERLRRYVTPQFLPRTIKSLRIHGYDESISLIMEGLHARQLESLALLGLSSNSMLTFLLENQKPREFELGRTGQTGVLTDLHLACLSTKFCLAKSLSLTLPTNRNDQLAKALGDNLTHLTYLSIVSRGSPGDPGIQQLVDTFFSEIQKLRFLVLKLDFPAAVIAQRVSADDVDADIRIKTVENSDRIAWPMLARLKGEYPGKQE